jgi:hypothetical protein
MSARFAATLVAFAAATAVVSRGHVLPEFLIQIHDPNLLGGPLFASLLRTFGFALVVAVCGILTAGCVLLVAWRTRMRGAPDIYAAFAATLAALCMIDRTGVSLDPIGWVCAGAFALVLDRTSRASVVHALAIVLVWSLLQGGATLAALLAICALIAARLDSRNVPDAVRGKALILAGAIIIGFLQLHAAPWHAYGPHVLYLDALAPGAQHDRLWTGGFTVPALSFCAMMVFAAWYGVRRRGRIADALAFFTMMLLAIADSRNLPYFGIIGAPIVADAAASYYIDVRLLPRGSVLQYASAFAAAAFTFIAVLTVTEPKAITWPQAAEQPAALLVALANDRRPHRLLCEQPRWCDGTDVVFPNIRPLLDDRAGIAPMPALHAQKDAVEAQGSWRRELREARVDAIIAQSDANIVALLTSTGWHAARTHAGQVLLRPVQLR